MADKNLTVSSATFVDATLVFLNFAQLNFNFDGGCTRKEQIALSLKGHLFQHGGRKPKAFWMNFSTLLPILNMLSNFSSSALKRHLLKRHLTLSEGTELGGHAAEYHADIRQSCDEGGLQDQSFQT